MSMLKKILEDGICPEEILNNISDEDKQLIFLEIRREQLRKYKLWQQTAEELEDFRHNPNKKGKNVGFYDDGILVSFLGEREGDKPIEDILREEAFKKAQKEAEIQIQKEFELTKELPVSDKIEIKIELVPQPLPIIQEPDNIELTKLKISPPELVDKPISKRANKSADQKRLEMVKRKSTELYQTYINHISELEETAIKEDEELTKYWEKSEEQAKSDEEQRRKMAEDARKLHAHINYDMASDSPDNKKIKPPPPSKKSEQLRFITNNIQKSNLSKSCNEIKSWFLEHEWNKLRIMDNSSDTVPQWFHGIISREKTEQLLDQKTIGSFLIRLSDKLQCYVLSYKSKSKIKHVLIESKIDSHLYKFFGPSNVTTFQSLMELISYFQEHPININTADILTDPCGQELGQTVDYMLLLQPDSNYCKTASTKCSI